MMEGNPSAVIESCVRLGDATRGGDPHLWTEVLEYLAAQDNDSTQHVRASQMLVSASVTCLGNQWL